MFYVVDIETGCTVPTPGALLTVGICMVEKDSILDQLYFHVAYDQNTFDQNTSKWWEEQGDLAKNEAFNWSLDRLHPVSAAAKIFQFVDSNSEKDQSFFVASPASFDYPWINQLFHFTGVNDPFSHRTLCLRSMRYGVFGGEFGNKRGEEHKPEVPHHALHDARAEAEDLIYLLEKINEGEYDPNDF